MTPADLIETEEEIRRLWEAGELPYLIHLEGSVDGSYEQFLCDYFHENVKPGDWIFSSHRCHYVWSLYAEVAARHALDEVVFENNRKHIYNKISNDLIARIKAGRSMFLYGPRFVCSAIVAGTASIAAGMALSIQRRGGTEMCHCFIGDAGSEHGHFLESMVFAHAKKLSLHFIICDNNSSCGVTKEQRRGSNDEIQWPACVTKFSYKPTWPHAGSLVRPQLKRQTP